MRGRQVLIESLLAHGVDRIFGNPGTTESPLLDSLPDYPALDSARRTRLWGSRGNRAGFVAVGWR